MTINLTNNGTATQQYNFASLFSVNTTGTSPECNISKIEVLEKDASGSYHNATSPMLNMNSSSSGGNFGIFTNKSGFLSIFLRATTRG